MKDVEVSGEPFDRHPAGSAPRRPPEVGPGYDPKTPLDGQTVEGSLDVPLPTRARESERHHLGVLPTSQCPDQPAQVVPDPGARM
jgi:hypothetical protein